MSLQKKLMKYKGRQKERTIRIKELQGRQKATNEITIASPSPAIITLNVSGLISLIKNLSAEWVKKKTKFNYQPSARNSL